MTLVRHTGEFLSEPHPTLYFSFDVESMGLHGDGFAVGWVVSDGVSELETGYASCDPELAQGTPEDRHWVARWVLPTLPASTHGSLREVRDVFWAAWDSWRRKGALCVTDCPWPVETNFLSSCIGDGPEDRKWGGPYPLIDVASVLLTRNRDPLAKQERYPNELPAHNPVNDARQSLRILLDNLRK